MVSLRLSFPGTLRERTRHREALKLTGALLICARGESANYLARFSNDFLILSEKGYPLFSVVFLLF